MRPRALLLGCFAVPACGPPSPYTVLAEAMSPDGQHLAVFCSATPHWWWSGPVENIELRGPDEPAGSGVFLFPWSEASYLQGIELAWQDAATLIVRYESAVVGSNDGDVPIVFVSKHHRDVDLTADTCGFRRVPLREVAAVSVVFECTDRESLESLSEAVSPDGKYAATHYRRRRDDFNVELREIGLPLGWGADLFHGAFRGHEPKVRTGPLAIHEVELEWLGSAALTVSYRARENDVAADAREGTLGVWTRHEVDLIRVSYEALPH